MEKFFEEESLQLMKKMSKKKFEKIIAVELQKAFKNMKPKTKKKVEELLKQFNEDKKR